MGIEGGAVGDLVPLALALLCGGLFALAVGGVGVFLVVYSLRSRSKARASQVWPGAPGRITAAETGRSASSDEDGRVRYAYYPSVAYVYHVAGRTYIGKRLSFGGVRGYRDPGKVAAQLARFPVGGEVTVYYNPQNPEEAVLEREAGGFVWGIVLGAVCLSICGCIACLLLVGILMNVRSVL